MFKNILKRGCVFIVSLALVSLGAPAVSYARIIDTETYVQAGQREVFLAKVQAGLHRAEIHDRFIALGVDPAQVETRLAGLSDSELSQLAQQMDRMPAGGDGLLEVIGLVFVVLLILQVVGVIDIFKKMRR
jgi:hypothetical protein